MSEKFPNTPAGIRAAIEITPDDEFWEERVNLTDDFSQDPQPEGPMVLAAVIQTAGSSPELFTGSSMADITRAAEFYGVEISVPAQRETTVEDIDPDDLILDYDPSTGVARSGVMAHSESIRSRWDMPRAAYRPAGHLATSSVVEVQKTL